MKNLIYILLALIVMAVVWKMAEPGNKEYNKHMCAVYGYFEDCKTPLPENLKLK